MKPALVLHLFYEDLARELVRRIAPVADHFDVFATGPIEHAVGDELRRVAPNAEWIASDGAGYDIGPFLTVLPILADRGYEVFCKLHTKRRGLLGQRWRELCLRTLIAEDAVTSLDRAFAKHGDLALAGPEDLYLSIETNLHANGAAMRRLAPLCFPELPLPRSWGFFAGTMFWGRVGAFAPMLSIARSGVELERSSLRRDGQTAHAVERLFGLVPLAWKGRVGHVESGSAAIHLRRPDAGLPLDSIAALARAGHPSASGTPSPAEAAAIAAQNPLLHYLRAREPERHDPNPWFSEEWYRRFHHSDGPALVEQARLGADAPPPGPLFDAGRYLHRRPWLRRRHLNALAHFIAAGATDAESTGQSPPEEDWRIGDSPEDEPGEHRRKVLTAALGELAEIRFAINIAAPSEHVSEWGDVSFAEGMAAALERLGHEAEIRRRDEWEEGGNPDVTIWLRGPEPSRPRPSSFNVLWVISHPDQVTIAEMEACDLVCVASAGWARFLTTYLDVPVMALLQATNIDRFRPSSRGLRQRPVLFVGNRRGEDREVVRWAVEAGIELEMAGHGWDGLIPPEILRGTRMDNRVLSAKYESAAAVLNDHWPAMTAFGIVSNRLIDVLAAGGVPVSDRHPEAREMLGGVIEIEEPAALAPALEQAMARPHAERLRLSRTVRETHSFDRRMSELADAVRHPPDAPTPSARGPAIVIVRGNGGPEGRRLAFQRLVSPLHHADFRLPVPVREGPVDAVRKGDLVIVACPGLTAAEAEDAAKAVRRVGAKLVIDYAANPAMGASGDRDRLLRALKLADEVWVPTASLAETVRAHARSVQIIADGLDQRLWRDFHRPPLYRPHGALRFCFWPGAEAGAIKGFARQLEQADGSGRSALAVLADPADNVPDGVRRIALSENAASYPHYAEWMRAEADFDIAVAIADAGDPAGTGKARRVYLEAAALGRPTLVIGSGGEAVAPRGLALMAEADDLSGLLARLMNDPQPVAAVASAARADLWRKNEIAAAAGLIDQRVRQLLRLAVG